MASIIRIKRSEVTGNPSTLAAGELAYSALAGTQSNGGDRLYIGMGTETGGDAANHYVIGGKYFTDRLDHVEGTLTANSAIIVDGSSKIDNLKVDNIDINGNTISATDTNGNVYLAPDGIGTVDVNSSRITSLANPSGNTDATNKQYVDAQILASAFLNVGTDSGGGYQISLDSDLNIYGHNNIHVIKDTSANNKRVIVGLDNSGATAGTYGSATAIPSITVNAQGIVTSVSTNSVATTLSMTGDSSTSMGIDLLNDTLDVQGDNPIKVLVDSDTNRMTVSVNRASTVGVGVASFSSADFSVDGAGAVDLADTVLKGITTDTGALTIASHGVSILGGEGMDVTHTGTTITVAGEDATDTNKGVASFSSATFTVTSGAVEIGAGQIDNSQLANSTLTLGSTTLTLGATTTDVAGLTSLVVDNITIDGNTIKSTDGSNTLYLDPAPVDSDGGDLVIRGNLIVQGTTTTVNSTTVSINDKNIVLADSAANAAAADGAGITIGGALYSGTKATLTYDGSNDRWEANKTLNLPAGLTSLQFNGVDATEVIEDHLATVFFGDDSTGSVITYNDGSDTFTWTNEYASLTNVGVASFGGYADSAGAPAPGNSRQFSVSPKGDVTIAVIDGGTY